MSSFSSVTLIDPYHLFRAPTQGQVLCRMHRARGVLVLGAKWKASEYDGLCWDIPKLSKIYRQVLPLPGLLPFSRGKPETMCGTLGMSPSLPTAQVSLGVLLDGSRNACWLSPPPRQMLLPRTLRLRTAQLPWPALYSLPFSSKQPYLKKQEESFTEYLLQQNARDELSVKVNNGEKPVVPSHLEDA